MQNEKEFVAEKELEKVAGGIKRRLVAVVRVLAVKLKMKSISVLSVL
ncbi:MAG TPA: hypothetical protein HPP94_16455 [Desulfuromonadales bacterium]|nr:hypothetical protein [Desulfuromonadales bacterium]